MAIIFRDHITRAQLRAEPNTLFVFGDNFIQRGLGGQAAEMRGEPNAVGIPTKRFPSMDKSAFLIDADYDEWAESAALSAGRLMFHRGDIVLPAAGIGTGLAKLEVSAPRIFRALIQFQRILSTK